MIELHILLRTLRSQTRPVIATFKSLARWARSESGCLAVQLSVAVEDSRCICYTEIWASEEELLRMIRSPHFSQLAALMELAADPPECEFRVIEEKRGLEFPARVRNCQDEAAGIASQNNVSPERLDGDHR